MSLVLLFLFCSLEALGSHLATRPVRIFDLSELLFVLHIVAVKDFNFNQTFLCTSLCRQCWNGQYRGQFLVSHTSRWLRLEPEDQRMSCIHYYLLISLFVLFLQHLSGVLWMGRLQWRNCLYWIWILVCTSFLHLKEEGRISQSSFFSNLLFLSFAAALKKPVAFMQVTTVQLSL